MNIIKIESSSEAQRIESPNIPKATGDGRMADKSNPN